MKELCVVKGNFQLRRRQLVCYLIWKTMFAVPDGWRQTNWSQWLTEQDKRETHFIIQEVATEHLQFLNDSESLHFSDKSTGSDQKKKEAFHRLTRDEVAWDREIADCEGCYVVAHDMGCLFRIVVLKQWKIPRRTIIGTTNPQSWTSLARDSS